MKKVLPPLRRAILFLSPLLILVLGFLPRGMKSIYMLQQGEEWETVTKYGPILEKTNLGYHPWRHFRFCSSQNLINAATCQKSSGAQRPWPPR